MTSAGAAGSVEAVFREERGRLLAMLVRQFGDLDLAEDAASDAIEPRWSAGPTPLAWLLTTARRDRAHGPAHRHSLLGVRGHSSVVPRVILRMRIRSFSSW